MFGDSLAFYSTEEVEKMFAEWLGWYEVLDLLNIEDELSPEALQYRPQIKFSYNDVAHELMVRSNQREELEG